MIGKKVNEVKKSQIFENGRRKGKGVNYLNKWNKCQFVQKETNVWKLYGVEPSLVKQTHAPSDVRGQAIKKTI